MVLKSPYPNNLVFYSKFKVALSQAIVTMQSCCLPFENPELWSPPVLKDELPVCLFHRLFNGPEADIIPLGYFNKFL